MHKNLDEPGNLILLIWPQLQILHMWAIISFELRAFLDIKCVMSFTDIK